MVEQRRATTRTELLRTRGVQADAMRSQCTLLLLALISVGGCITRPGMNADCQWPAEASRQLDLQRRADRRHLIEDAELAEELAVRYDDRWHKGIPPCEIKLFNAIAATHGVTAADVVQARERIADKGLYLPVNLPMAALYLLTACAVTQWVRRRFADDERAAAIVAVLFASIVFSGLFVVLGELWEATVLMIRVWNHHVGGRALRLPWQQHRVEIFVLGVVLFWIVAVVLYRWGTSMRRRPPEAAR